MEIKLPVSELKAALPALARIVSRSPSLPVLHMLRISRSQDGIVQLQATDLESFVSYRLEGQAGEPLEMLVAFKSLSRAVKGCSPTDQITLVRDNDNTVLRSLLAGRPVERSLESMDPQQWPEIPAFQDAGIVLDDGIKEGILRALSCCTHEITRAAIMGAWLDVTDPEAHYVMGTDGRHLYSANSFHIDLQEPILIPHEGFLESPAFRNDGPWSIAVQAGATFVNPNHFAALMVVLLPLALAQTFLGRTKGPIRVFHGYAAAMMAAGLAVTMSRGGWLAGGTVLVTFFVWLLIRRRQMRIPALVGLATVVVGALLFLGMSSKARQRIEGVNAEGTADSGNRAPLWKPAWAMWKDHPWLGVGPGHYDVRFPQYRDHTIQTSPAYAHNEYLNTLADYGAIGAGLAGLGVLALTGGILLSRKYVERGIGDLGDKGSNRTAFFVGGSIGMAGIAIHCAGDFILHIPALGLVVVTLASMLASTVRFATERWWHTPRWWSRIPVTAAAGASLVFLG